MGIRNEKEFVSAAVFNYSKEIAERLRGGRRKKFFSVELKREGRIRFQRNSLGWGINTGIAVNCKNTPRVRRDTVHHFESTASLTRRRRRRTVGVRVPDSSSSFARITLIIRIIPVIRSVDDNLRERFTSGLYHKRYCKRGLLKNKRNIFRRNE